MQGNSADLSDPVRWLSPQSDSQECEREFLASLRHVDPSADVRRAVWDGIESAAKKLEVESESGARRRRSRRSSAALRG